MKILHISTSDTSGGAARAAYRLNKGLNDAGVNSSLLAHDKFSDDRTVLGAEAKSEKVINKTRAQLDRLPVNLYREREKILFSPACVPFSNIIKKINKTNPDIVHLHWIAGGMVKTEDLVKIKIPIVWSLHDMWAFTGGCHYDNYCGKYVKDCGACPALNSDRKNDLSRKVFCRKEKTYKKINNLVIVGLSRWIADCASASRLLKDRKIVNIPNPIDTQAFSPVQRSAAREILGLPQGKKLILFGAQSINNYLKGFSKLIEALGQIKTKNLELVTFGARGLICHKQFNFSPYYFGKLHDDISLKILYSAVDVTVLPSLQENLSNVIMESLSCGTPVAAFDIGGNGDMIVNKENGYLAEPFYSDSLAEGIDWILNNDDYEVLRQKAREKVVRRFDTKVIANKYIELYKGVFELKNFH